MTYTYTENTDAIGAKSITRIDQNGVEAWIPCDSSNADYQAYLNKDTLPSELSIPSTPQAGA
jgi:hypothetical protein